MLFPCPISKINAVVFPHEYKDSTCYIAKKKCGILKPSNIIYVKFSLKYGNKIPIYFRI